MNQFKSIFLIITKLYLFLFIVSCNNNLKIKNDEIKKDSIKIWINLSKTKSFNIKKRNLFLNKAYYENKQSKKDTIKSLNLGSIADVYYKLNDSINFISKNEEAYELAKEMNHVYGLAYVHWNYASFYNKRQEYEKAYYHFNKAHSFFDKKNDHSSSGIMLYAMASIKGVYRDYIQAEILIVKAIKRFKIANNNRRIYTSYSALAELQQDIKEYDRALHYYDISLTYSEKLTKREKKTISIYNNIANIYVEKGEFTKALEYYNKEILKKINRPESHARILNNRAYCKLLMKDTSGVKKDFFKVLKIRDSIHNKAGVVNSNIYISDYYKYLKDTVNAIKHAKEANILAKKIKNGGDYLTTLKQLANLDKKKSKKYLDRYIIFNDSLIKEERRAQNKFTRIEFETDEYIEEAEKLTQQNLLITISSIGTILVLSLLYFIRVQRGNNEKLRLEAEQQKANEEVYILTLEQQAKLEEERVNERNRISAELHDGVLGKLFGTRVNLGFLGMQMNTTTQEKHQTFLDELQTIEKEIRDVSHKLSDNFDDASINFATILKQLLKEKSIIGSFEYEFKQEKIDWKKINQITKANVYRIIQEALQNIIKHAKAKKVILDVSIVNQNLVMTLKDDGVGFDMKKSKKGIGLKNIKSRLKKLHGTLELVSEINKGTTLIINSPYNTNEQ